MLQPPQGHRSDYLIKYHRYCINSVAKPTHTSWLRVHTHRPFPIQPLLSEASLTLALNQIEHQLNVYNLELDLSLAIIRFLSVVASTAKRCTVSGGKDEAPPIYTPTQANSIINLLNETKVLRHVMKVPQDIRSDPDFQCHYSVVVKCLAPKRGKRKAMLRRGTTSELLQAQSASPSPPVSQAVPSSIPPPKPKRLFRNRRSTFGARSHGGNDNKSKVCVHYLHIIM